MVCSFCIRTTVLESHEDLLEGPVFSLLTTIKPDGEPARTVIWASYNGKYILVNTGSGHPRQELEALNNGW